MNFFKKQEPLKTVYQKSQEALKAFVDAKDALLSVNSEAENELQIAQAEIARLSQESDQLVALTAKNKKIINNIEKIIS